MLTQTAKPRRAGTGNTLPSLTRGPLKILRRLRQDRTILFMQTRNWHCFLEMLLCAFLLVEGRLNHWHCVNGSPCMYGVCYAKWMPAPGNIWTPQISGGGKMGDTYFEQEYLGKVADTAGLDSGVSGHGQQTCQREKCVWQNAAQPEGYMHAVSQLEVSGGL